VASGFADTAGWQASPSLYATIQFPDVDGDGVRDVCGRSRAGVVCALGRQSPEPGFGATTLWSPDFSDEQGWADRPARWGSIRFPDVNGDGRADVCGFGSSGHRCALSTGKEFSALDVWGPPLQELGETAALPEVWATVQYPDLDHDGKDDTCARAPLGIHCALSSGQGFGFWRLWSSGLKDGWLGMQPKVWPTLQIIDVTADGLPDLCARGYYQLACLVARPGGEKMNDRWMGEMNAEEFGDQLGFGGGISYYGSIRPADVNGDGKLDLCGKNPEGLWCLRSSGFAATLHATRWTAQFSDAAGWARPEHALSIELADLDGDGRDDVCGRRADGLHCALSNGRDGFLPATVTAAFRDADGFARLSSASTVWFGNVLARTCRGRPGTLRRPLELAVASGMIPVE
jgi:hypothetical protein